MFENLNQAPPDAIFGLNEAMRRDPRPEKINLGAGVYQDEEGITPVLAVVKEAERRILDGERSKTYLPIEGEAEYDERVQTLLLGAGHESWSAGRAVTVQTPGGTGALRIFADFLRRHRPASTIWLSQPTWPNHPAIFNAAGLVIRTFPQVDAATNRLDLAGQLEAFKSLEEGDVVVLHGCCHNPTGVDPSPEEWRRIAEVLARKKALPLFDFAYQGFVDGVEADAEGLRGLCAAADEVVVCNSFSKNFGLYNERIGALTILASRAGAATAVLSHIKSSARVAYSNPPGHGAAIVTTILRDPELRRRWEEELGGMRSRIRCMRRRFAEGLDARGVRLHPSGNRFMTEQKGMFSYTGLSRDQVRAIRENDAIYMVDSGRINVAGLTEENCGRVCDAIAAVLSP